MDWRDRQMIEQTYGGLYVDLWLRVNVERVRRHISAIVRNRFAFGLQQLTFGHDRVSFGLEQLPFDSDHSASYRFGCLEYRRQYRFFNSPKIERFCVVRLKNNRDSIRLQFQT